VFIHLSSVKEFDFKICLKSQQKFSRSTVPVLERVPDWRSANVKALADSVSQSAVYCNSNYRQPQQSSTLLETYIERINANCDSHTFLQYLCTVCIRLFFVAEFQSGNILKFFRSGWSCSVWFCSFTFHPVIRMIWYVMWYKCDMICEWYTLVCLPTRHDASWKPELPAPIDYCYVRPHHIPAVNALCREYFWPGIDSQYQQFVDLRYAVESAVKTLKIVGLKLVICSRNPVPKFITRFQIRVIDTRFLHSLLMKNTILACLCISLCDDLDFPYFLWSLILYVFMFDNSITGVKYEKIVSLWKIFGNWVCTCHCFVVFPYLLKSWNRVPG